MPTNSPDLDAELVSSVLGGEFQIVRRIGRGAMGSVYLARELAVHRVVAIKVLRWDRAGSTADRDRFRSEARIAAQLRHPGIVPLFRFVDTADVACMVMEYVSGESLADRLRRDGTLDPETARRILIELGTALEYAHRQGVVHRDLKPENVLLEHGADGERFTRVVLADFGVAARPSHDPGPNAERGAFGTPHFMSPEQAAGEIDVDARSDVYALGVLGYLALAGRPPFDGSNAAAIAAARATERRAPLREVAPAVPDDLVDAIERCLAPEPEDRWRHARDFVTAIAGGDRRHPWARRQRAVLGRVRRRAAGARGGARRELALEPTLSPRGAFADAVRDALRYAARSLRRAPGFAVAVALTLGLGIGANATMFGVVDRLLLRPPPHVADLERIVRPEMTHVAGGVEYTNTVTSYPIVRDLRDRVPAFDNVAAYTDVTSIPLGRGSAARQVRGQLVTASYFPTLGVRPALGRFFLPGEDREGTVTRIAILSEALWRREYGRDPRVLGRTLQVGNEVYQVVGVAPRGFTGVELAPVDLWLPITSAGGMGMDFEWWNARNTVWIHSLAHLRPGFSVAQAAQQASIAYRTGEEAAGNLAGGQHGGARADRVVLRSVVPGEARWGDPTAKVSALLAGVSAFVLLIACANVANLLLARAIGRRREIAVRVALGIGRGRLVGQLLAESLVLASLGAVAALAMVHFGGRVFGALLLGDAAWDGTPVDGRVLAFTALAALVTGVLTGLVPALQSSAPDLTTALKQGAREGATHRSRTRVALLVVQAAVSVVLLVGLGVFVRSLMNVNAIRIGFDPDRVVVASVDLASVGYTAPQIAEYFRRLEDRVGAIPGIEAASVATTTPFSGSSYSMRAVVPGLDSLPRTADGGPYFFGVGDRYFEVMGTRLLRGRVFTAADRASRARVVVVNETLARLYWPGAEALGQCMRIGADTAPCSQVVGVIENTRRQRVLGEPPSIQYFVPIESLDDGFLGARVLVARAAGDAARAVGTVRREMLAADPDLPYAHVRPMRTMLGSELRPWELGSTMFAVFGALALVLATVGLYSVISYSVNQRTHEMGVRIALGARGAHVLGLVVGQGVRFATLGIVVGIAATVALSPFARPLLVGVSPTSVPVMASVCVVVLAVAVVASWVPARRATRVDPMTALRNE